MLCNRSWWTHIWERMRDGSSPSTHLQTGATRPGQEGALVAARPVAGGCRLVPAAILREGAAILFRATQRLCDQPLAPPHLAGSRVLWEIGGCCFGALLCPSSPCATTQSTCRTLPASPQIHQHLQSHRAIL